MSYCLRSPIIFVATDSVFDSLSETGYADIPLATIALLPDGRHTDYVVDKGAPVVTNAQVDPSPTLGLTDIVTLTAPATDTTSTIAMAEWFVGTDPGQGMAMSMAATEGAFDSLSEGLTASVDIAGWDNVIYLL